MGTAFLGAVLLGAVFLGPAGSAADFLAAVFFAAAFLDTVLSAAVFSAAVLSAAVFFAAAFLGAGAVGRSAAALPWGCPFGAGLLAAAFFVEPAAVFLEVRETPPVAGFPDAVSKAVDVFDVDFRGVVVLPGGSWVVLPDFATAAAERSDAVVSAVFFASMAAAPSHIVILLANRAGTINRPQPRGNGARRRLGPPRAARSRACIRCAQLPAQ
ncbi:hypothetical protein GCM10010381_16130 [Streptomyces xantholiticus]|nr:hypothetical protein GCM10010381_16130 [Streptomyces xantholiticus]